MQFLEKCRLESFTRVLLPLAERNVIWQTNVVTDILSGAFYSLSMLLVTPMPTSIPSNAAHEGGFTLSPSVFHSHFKVISFVNHSRMCGSI